MLNFSIAYGKTLMGLAKDWKVSVEEAKNTVDLWYKERQEVLEWQKQLKYEVVKHGHVQTLLGRARRFPLFAHCTQAQEGHIERAAINTPVQMSNEVNDMILDSTSNQTQLAFQLPAHDEMELRILAHLTDCKSMLDAFKAGGDFHSRTAMNMCSHIREAVEKRQVLLEWHPRPGEEKPPIPLLKDAFASERRKAKMLNFSIAYGKTPMGLAKDWKVSVEEAKNTVDLWYKERQEMLEWQKQRKYEAAKHGHVQTLLGRARHFPSYAHCTRAQEGHIERAAINTPVQGSAADVAMCAMLQISKNKRLKELGWRLVLQVHDEVNLGRTK
ncbi:DNA polymerase I B, chloroplastic/mitochondrial-like isoform X1 [Durio zibethinus]|uniref:DNA polymerase I B, chloroplastic/mitochondrial-like isoform X1 n=1 Tax=Durio zibethinus TaxID=66656 RepID=A0A6P5ZJT0_DURZI|nr:DNA polymerase I B, chloroplastic/mitochondrial-like isoform X1 [Durio zibethinus]